MITIQSGMLVALGFLVATLLGLLTAPAFWARAVRLTTRRLKNSMPLSEMEIEADRDRIRAEYAIKMHKLESLVEQVKMAAARQQIEINRRDARVNMLEGDLDSLKASYEEAQNARRVLEQTIADRLPRVELRLTDAKKLLHSRDREISELTGSVDRQRRALSEATAINTQQKNEIVRLETSLVARTANGSGSRTERETALRAELEALRAKTREQAQLLTRMQSLAGRTSGAALLDEGASGDAPRSAQDGMTATSGERELQHQIRALKARNDDQAGEIARLKAALAVFELDDAEGGKASIKESRLGLKARVQSLEAQTNRQSETVQKLRSELAAANERLARQADHFTGELRRLGSSGGPGGAPRGRRGVSAGAMLSEGSANGRTNAPTEAETAESPPAAAGLQVVSPRDASNGRMGELAEAGTGLQVDERAAHAADTSRPVATEDTVAGRADVVNANASAEADALPADAKVVAPVRPRLIDRIAGMSRGS